MLAKCNAFPKEMLSISEGNAGQILAKCQLIKYYVVVFHMVICRAIAQQMPPQIQLKSAS